MNTIPLCRKKRCNISSRTFRPMEPRKPISVEAFAACTRMTVATVLRAIKLGLIKQRVADGKINLSQIRIMESSDTWEKLQAADGKK